MNYIFSCASEFLPVKAIISFARYLTQFSRKENCRGNEN